MLLPGRTLFAGQTTQRPGFMLHLGTVSRGGFGSPTPEGARVD